MIRCSTSHDPVKEDQIGHWLLHAGVVAVPSYGVCSTRNVDMVGSLGADRVMDYAQEDFTRTDRRYDLMLDVAGSRVVVGVPARPQPAGDPRPRGSTKGNRLMGPLGHIVRVRVASLRASQKVTPVVERSYALSEAADAFRYLGEGHAQGKLVIIV
jgi:NADPH:quinone reductase-like Zn-dependent oxidoreductase